MVITNITQAGPAYALVGLNDSINGSIAKTGAAVEDEMYDVNDELIAILMPIVFAVIFIVGLVGNGCVISSVIRYKSMRTAPNFFIVNLAIGDVIMILISVPTSALIYTIQGWPYGLIMCKLSYFVKTLSLGVSIFTLTALSIDRVSVIAQTMKLRQEKTTQRITIMVIVVWVASILVAIPDAVHYKLYEAYIENGTGTIFCWGHESEWFGPNYNKIYSMAHVVIFFILPLVIISICYSIMAHLMLKSSHGIPGETVESTMWRRKQMQTRKKVANTVIILILLFFICWLPRSVLILIYFYSENFIVTPTVHYVRIVAYCLQFSNCCINPIALYFLSKSFKTHYKKQICCGREWVKTSDTDLTTKQSQTNQGECQLLTKAPVDFIKQEQTSQSEVDSKLCV